MPYRGGGLGYSVKDCAVVISSAGVMILLTQINSESRIKVALRAFPVRTFRFQITRHSCLLTVILQSRSGITGILFFFVNSIRSNQSDTIHRIL